MHFDTNGTGKIPVPEMRYIMCQLGGNPTTISDKLRANLGPTRGQQMAAEDSLWGSLLTACAYLRARIVLAAWALNASLVRACDKRMTILGDLRAGLTYSELITLGELRQRQVCAQRFTKDSRGVSLGDPARAWVGQCRSL